MVGLLSNHVRKLMNVQGKDVYLKEIERPVLMRMMCKVLDQNSEDMWSLRKMQDAC